eukprot:gene6708-3378_t
MTEAPLGGAWHDFGQKVDLTARIREVLLNYPEGTSILKESIQNADDARATVVRFCLDRRQHPTGSLLGPSLASFQGASLLVYNDSVFSEKDYESISRIGESVKKEQAGKTGRFGVGFNSCYHITDLPSFVSGSDLVIFDPHCKFLPNVSSTNPGKRINFVSHRDAVKEFSDQLLPYKGAFGCDPLSGKAWPATLFRLPLRTQALASQSNISKQQYNVEKVEELLGQLQEEATLMLLFLKTVGSIEVFDWAEGQPSPSLRFTCSIGNQSARLSQERSLFLRVSQEAATPSGDPVPTSSSCFKLDIKCNHHARERRHKRSVSLACSFVS